MKTLVVAILLALLGALLITALYKPKPFEAQLLNLQIARKMPETASELTGEAAEIQALFLSYADDPVLLAKARLALLRYPDIARPIFLTYGDGQNFREVLRRYGEDITLPIHYFMTHEVLTLELMHGVNETSRSALSAIRGLWDDKEPAHPLAKGAPSSEERGHYAIQFIKADGYDFLGQFVISPKGEVSWIQTERVLEGLNSFFAGGVKGLESKLRQEETIAAGDVGWAALDVAIGVSALKVLRMGRGAVAGGRSLSFTERSAALGAGLWRGSAIGARIVKYGAPAVLAYIAIRHPSVINSFFGYAAEKLGLPTGLVQIAGWTLVLLPIILLLRFMLRPIAWIMATVGHMLRWTDKSLRRGPASRVGPRFVTR